MLGARCFLLLLISRDRFTFADLGLNLLHHVQIFRIGPVIIQTGTRNNQHQRLQMRQSSIKQYFVLTSSKNEIYFPLLRRPA